MPFDPYHKWLGIPPKDQPPNYYRLLALDLYESDPDVIDAAADRQMAFLRQCSGGPHVAQSQKLLNEIAAARLCLLNSDGRTAYDAKLRRDLARKLPWGKVVVGVSACLSIAALAWELSSVLSQGTKSNESQQNAGPSKRPRKTEQVATAKAGTIAANTPPRSGQNATGDDALSPAGEANNASSLVILEAKYGARETWVDLTERVGAASRSGLLIMVAHSALVGKDPVPGVSKQLKLRYRLQGRVYEQSYGDHSVVLLDDRPAGPARTGTGLDIIEAWFGGGVLGEGGWVDVTEHLRLHVPGNRLSLTVSDAMQGAPAARADGPKALVVRYSFEGHVLTTPFREDDVLALGADPLAGKLPEAGPRPGNDSTDGRMLSILDARYGAKQTWFDLTDRVRSASTAGTLVMVVNTALVGNDPFPGTTKLLKLRYRQNGKIIDDLFGEGSVVQLDGRSYGPTKPDSQLAILEASFGGGIRGETEWIDVRLWLNSKIKDNRLDIPVGEIIQGLPRVGSGPRVLAVRYSFEGEVQTTNVDEGGVLRLGKQ